VKFAALLLVGIAVAASIAWFASEQHYDNCVEAASAEFPLGESGLTAQEKRTIGGGYDWDYEGGNNPLFEEIEDRPRQRRKAALNDCSRVPW